MEGEMTVIEKARERKHILRVTADFYDFLSECQGTQDSLYISEMASSDMMWQEGHRSLGLIVPYGWHPGQNWNCFT